MELCQSRRRVEAEEALHKLAALSSAARAAQEALHAGIVHLVEMRARPTMHDLLPMERIAKAVGISRTQLYRMVKPEYLARRRGTAPEDINFT